jgi:hypothetical protein
MEFTDYVVIEQAYQGGGFDYWLGRDDDALFQGAARLEVSGTCSGRYEANSRKNKKLKQTDPSDASGLPAFVVVVDFKTPMAWVVRK